MIQWLGVCTVTAGARVQESKIPQVEWHGKKKKKRKMRGLTPSHTARKCINWDLNPMYNCYMLFYYFFEI